jgi:hypothetical protein
MVAKVLAVLVFVFDSPASVIVLVLTTKAPISIIMFLHQNLSLRWCISQYFQDGSNTWRYEPLRVFSF